MTNDLDDIDKAIIRELQQDGRLTFAQLGPRVGLSQAAARQRVTRLIDGGTMQVVAVTDPVRLGFEVQAMIGIKVEGDVKKAAESMATIEEVDYLVISSGRYDLLVELVAADGEALLDLVNDKVRAVPGVVATETFTYLRLVKQTYAWGTR